MSLSDRMQIFAAVVEMGSMTAAAKSLGFGKAYVSQQVRRLEEELSIQLLHRTTRKIIVTEAGSVYYQHCKALVKTISQAQIAMEEMGNQVCGQVRISSPQTLGEHLLSPFIQGLSSDYPGLSITLDLTNEILDLKAQGIDLSLRICEQPPEDMVARPLGILKEVICASPTYLAQIETPSQPHQLSDLACLTLSPPSRRARHWLFCEGEKVFDVPIQPKFHCNSYRILRDLAVNGQGIVVLPRYLAQDALSTGKLLPILENFETRGEPLYLIYPVLANRPNKVRVVIEQLCAYLANKL